MPQRPALRKHDDEVQLYAFDILVFGGEDLRQLPLRRIATQVTAKRQQEASGQAAQKAA